MCPPTTTTTTTTTLTTTTTTTTTISTTTTTLDEHTDKIQFTAGPRTSTFVENKPSNEKWEIIRSTDNIVSGRDSKREFGLRGVLPAMPSSSAASYRLHNPNTSFKALNHRCGFRYKKLRNKFYDSRCMKKRDIYFKQSIT